MAEAEPQLERRPLLGTRAADAEEPQLDTRLSNVQNRNLYLATFAAVLGPLSFGFVLGYSSPSIPELRESRNLDLRLDDNQASWFGRGSHARNCSDRQLSQTKQNVLCISKAAILKTLSWEELNNQYPADTEASPYSIGSNGRTKYLQQSVVTLGAAAGGILGGYVVDKVGRKLSLMSCAVPFVVGFLTIISAQNIWMLYVGRLLTGMASGITSLVVPVYISEIAHSRVRGMLGSCVQLMVVTGILGAYMAGMVLEWRWLAVLCSIPPSIMICLMAFMPETPRFLLSRGHCSEAHAALQFLRGPLVDHDRECREIEDSAGEQQELSVAELKNPTIYKPFLIGITMMFFQQVSGINAIMFYAKTIFEEANFKNSAVASVIVGTIQVFFTAVAALIIDRVGRKILLVVSGLIMATSSSGVAVYFKMAFTLPSNGSHTGLLDHSPTATVAEEHDLAWLALLSLSLFIMGFALGWGPIPWLVMSEISPLRARGAASGACVLTNWLMAFLVTKEFHDLMALLTPAGTFWLFASTCLFNVLFTVFCVPETRGKTLEEIEAHFRGSH